MGILIYTIYRKTKGETKMKSDYRVRASRFLRSILPYIGDVLTDIYEVEERVKDFNRDHSRKVEVVWGSARIALITSDYVVKWDYDADCVKDIGGCVDEYDAYMKAKSEGFAYLLAETTLTVINGTVFSIMPRINNIGPEHHKGEIKDYLTPNEYDWIWHFNKDIHHYNWGIRHGKACVIDYAMTQEVYARGCL